LQVKARCADIEVPRSGKCGAPRWKFVGPSPVPRTSDRVATMSTLAALQLPIDWTLFGWPETPGIGNVTLTTGDPKWAWKPAAPAFEIHTMESPPSVDVPGFVMDHPRPRSGSRHSPFRQHRACSEAQDGGPGPTSGVLPLWSRH